MNNKKRITTGLVGATLLCATNTVIVQAQEQPQATSAVAGSGVGEKLTSLITPATANVNDLVESMKETMGIGRIKEPSPSMMGPAGLVSVIKDPDTAKTFLETAQYVEGTQGEPDVSGKQDFVFDTTNPTVTLKPNDPARVAKVTPGAFVDPYGNAVLNMRVKNPTIPENVKIKDAVKFGWTKPGEKEECDDDGSCNTVEDSFNPVVSIPNFRYYIHPGTGNENLFKDASNKYLINKDGSFTEAKSMDYTFTRGEGIVRKGDFLALTQRHDSTKEDFGVGVSKMFTVGETKEFDFPVTVSRDTYPDKELLGGFGVAGNAKLTINRTQEYGTPQRVETSEGDVMYSVSVKNTGNVAVGGYHITAPDGTKGKLEGKDVLQPGETGTLSVKYKTGADKDVALKVGAANLPEKTVTHVGKFAKLEWGNLLFAGNPVNPKTPIRVQADKQLVFQIGVKNTGNDSLTAIPVKLPNGEIYTAKQTIEPGKKTSINVLYTPKKGETDLSFTALAPGQPEKIFTAKIDPQTPKATTAPTQPKDTASPAKPTPEQNKKLWDLGTLKITDPIEEGDSFKLPLKQLKNPSNDVWAGMFVVSEDGKFVKSLDDGDALAHAQPGRNFSNNMYNDYTPSSLDEYTGKKKQTFTIYSGVPSRAKTLTKGQLDFVKDYGTPVATFDYQLLNFVTEYENYFLPVKVKDRYGKNIDKDNINLMPGDEFAAEFLLKKDKNQKRSFGSDLEVVKDGKATKLKNNGASRYGSKDFVLTAPEKTGKEKVEYHFKPAGDDVFTLNRGEFTVRNVLKDDSKVPQVEIDRGILGKLPGKPGEETVISVKKAASSGGIKRACDTDGKCYKVERGEFKYTPTKGDLKTPKKFFLVDDRNLVVGKMDVPFDQKLTESKIEATGKKEHTGYFGDSFEQELTIHNYTPGDLQAVSVLYRSKQNDGKYKNTSTHPVVFDTPLKSGESTTVTVNVTPQFEGVDTYAGVFALNVDPKAEDVTKEVTFNLSENPENTVEPDTDSETETQNTYIDVEVPLQTSSNRAPYVEVDVEPGKWIRYSLQNETIYAKINVKVTDKLIAKDGSGKEHVLNPVALDRNFDGTLLPGERVQFIAEVPDDLDPEGEYHTYAKAVGEVPPKVHYSSAIDPDYEDDPASVAIISPIKDKVSHIVVEDPGTQYVTAKNPENIEIVSTDMRNVTRTYKNPDGSIITVSPNEITFEMEGSDLKYRHRGTNKFLEQVMPDGTFKLFRADDSGHLSFELITDPHVAKKNVKEDGSFQFDYVEGVHLVASKEGNRRFHVDGLDSIPWNFPYLKHNMADFYQDVVGAVEEDAEEKYFSTFMSPSEPENSVMVDNGRGGVVLTAAAAQTRGPGSYEEEFDVFDRITFTSQKVKVGYTIHPDGTASVDFIESPEGMEFDVSLYRPKGSESDVYVDEQGRTHDGSGNKDTAMDRLRNRFAGKDADSRSASDESGRVSDDAEDVDDEDEKKDETPFSGALAVTGVPAGAAATVLLALMSLLGALVVVRRGRSGRGE